MVSDQIAKKRLPLNIISNYFSIGVIAVIGFFITPYLIKYLGAEIYGVIPLFYSVANYFNMLSSSISGAVTRFVGVTFGQDDRQANIYYSTSFYALLGLGCLIMVLGFGLSFTLDRIFSLPQGRESEAFYLFIMIILASVIKWVSSTFKVSTFITHKFYLENHIKVAGWLIHFASLYILFNMFAPNLISVGYSYLALSIVHFVGSVFIAKSLTPQLGIHPKDAKLKAFKEMAGMSFWSVLDELGTLLFFSIDLVVVNIFLGTGSVGRYAPVVQWGILMSTLGGAVSALFTPIAYQYVADNNFERLVSQTIRCMKYMGLLMAYPIGIVCGLATPLMTIWLGHEFANLGNVLFVLVFPQVLYLSIAPLYAVERGLNKVRIPAIATFIGGIINLVLSIYVAKYTSLGIMGVALATTLCLTLRSAFVTPIYNTMITKSPYHRFITATCPGTLCCALIAVSCMIISRYILIDSYLKLAVTSALVCLIWAPIQFFIFLDEDDRSFFCHF